MQNKPKIIVQAILLFAMAALFAVVPILSLQQEEITDLTTITATEIDNYIKKPVEMNSGDYKILSGSSMWERHQAAGEEPSGDYVTAFYPLEVYAKNGDVYVIAAELDADKKDMVPSQKAREKALKRTSQQGISRVYTIIGGGVLVIGIIFALIPVALDISSRTKYGFATDDVITATIILELMGLFLALTGVIFIVVGKYAIKSAEKALSKGEINYPAAESKHTKEQLLQEAATIGQLPNSILTLEVFGDWIDFTAILGSMMLDDDTVFKKLILVQNDYTYRELDYEYGRAIVSDSVGLEEGRTTLGKVQKRKIIYRKSQDGSITREVIDTTNITNDVHKWLADRGYSKVG